MRKDNRINGWWISWHQHLMDIADWRSIVGVPSSEAFFRAKCKNADNWLLPGKTKPKLPFAMQSSMCFPFRQSASECFSRIRVLSRWCHMTHHSHQRTAECLPIHRDMHRPHFIIRRATPISEFNSSNSPVWPYAHRFSSRAFRQMKLVIPSSPDFVYIFSHYRLFLAIA